MTSRSGVTVWILIWNHIHDVTSVCICMVHHFFYPTYIQNKPTLFSLYDIELLNLTGIWVTIYDSYHILCPPFLDHIQLYLLTPGFFLIPMLVQANYQGYDIRYWVFSHCIFSFINPCGKSPGVKTHNLPWVCSTWCRVHNIRFMYTLLLLADHILSLLNLFDKIKWRWLEDVWDKSIVKAIWYILRHKIATKLNRCMS